MAPLDRFARTLVGLVVRPVLPPLLLRTERVSIPSNVSVLPGLVFPFQNSEALCPVAE
jgi:hypothetical protein